MDFGGTGMTTTTQSPTRLIAFLCVLSLSAASMLWMLWRFPLGTTIAAVLMISVFGLLARVAQSFDGEGQPALGDLEGGNQNA